MKWDRTKRGNANLVQQHTAAGLAPDAAVAKAYPGWPDAKKQQLVAQMGGDAKEREELEQWQMTVEEDDPGINEKGRRLKVLQDADLKRKDHVKLAMRTTDRDKNAARRVIEKAADIEGNLSSYLDDVGGDFIPDEYVASSMLRPPTATNTAIGAGVGGVIGALINYLRKKSPVRGAFTGGLTGAGLAAGSDMAGNVGGGLGYLASGNLGLRQGPSSTIGRQLSSPVGAGLGGLGGYSLAQYLLDRDEKDEEKEAACRVISKVTSLVKDPKKHKWLDDSREGFGHWAGPPSVAKGDIEPKNVKAAQKPCSAKHDCDKEHPGLTHKEWKALKGQRHEIQKNAGVSREALGAILGALLGGAGGYHLANQMAEPGSAIGGEVHPWRPGYPSNWKEGLIGAAITGIPSAALGGYIGSALTPKDEDEEE